MITSQTPEVILRDFLLIPSGNFKRGIESRSTARLYDILECDLMDIALSLMISTSVFPLLIICSLEE